MSIIGRHLSPEQKEAIKADIRDGVPYYTIMSKHGCASATMTRLRREVQEETSRHTPLDARDIIYPEHPADDIPTEEIIRSLSRRFEHRARAARSREWQPIRVSGSEPSVIAFVGDPHLDDDGTNWPLLEEHIELMRRPGVYAINVGDCTNNWAGRLMKLYADQETSKKTARELARWFMNGAGVRWLAWVMGNHDAWDGGSDVLRLMNVSGIPMEDWKATIQVEFANGISYPICISHSFKGHSQYNKLHGTMRWARERRGATIYASGHTHEWAIHSEEIADLGEVFWAVKARGYKYLDQYAITNGFASEQFGATVAAVLDPRSADPVRSVQCFGDLAQAIDYRDFLASR